MFLRRLRGHELRAAREAAGVTVCSMADRDWFAGHSGLDLRQLCVVPNGYDPARIAPPDAETRRLARARLGLGEEDKVALFIGSDQPPNRRAVEDLLRIVLPRLTDDNIRLAIVGRVGERLADVRDARVIVTGGVDDVLPWLQAADVGLNPVSEGSGSNVKLAEYAAAGLPVVTTAFGLRGYEALGQWLSVCEIGAFAEAIGRASWPSAMPAEAIGAFAWPAVAAAVEAFYARLGRE